MSKHTPGPWRVLTGGLIWTDQPGPHGIEPDGHSIAQMTEHRTSLGTYVEEADARLIADAPELLRCLALTLGIDMPKPWPSTDDMMALVRRHLPKT